MNEEFTVISTAILLLFVLDPFGNVALLVAILKDIDKEKHIKIIIREMIIGLCILLFFLFLGKPFLELFHLDTASVTLAGGLIFLIIALKLIFPGKSGTNIFSTTTEPFIVPIAMPMVAGPSALATILVLAKQQIPNGNLGKLTLALLIAWFLTAAILLSSPLIIKVLRQRGLIAMERLMGMLLLIMAVQMLLNGMSEFVSTLSF